MPGFQYRRYINGEDDAELDEMTRSEIVFAQMTARGRHWPKTIGVVEIVVGMIITLLGVMEVFIIPMIESEDGKNTIVFDKRNCYGCGLLAGLVMVVTGSTAIRASLSQRNTTVYRFFNLTIACLIIYSILTLLLIVAYSKGWTSSDAYKNNSHIQEAHVFLTIFTVLGLLFAVTGFVQYFDVICCGEYPLWVQWTKCFEPCCCCFTQVKGIEIRACCGCGEDVLVEDDVPVVAGVRGLVAGSLVSSQSATNHVQIQQQQQQQLPRCLSNGGAVLENEEVTRRGTLEVETDTQDAL